MLKNYLKVTLRKIRRDKINSFINIIGLSIGFASVIVIFLFVHHELSYDKFHTNYDNLYRLTYDDSGGNGRHLATTAPPMGKAIVENFPEVAQSAIFMYPPSTIIQSNGAKFYEEGVIYADSNFLSLLSFPLLKGNPATALSAPNSIIISEAMAQKYFFGKDPVGETLIINEGDLVEVTGIFAALPSNSHIQFDFLASIQNYPIPKGFEVSFDEWGWVSFHTFLLLKDKADPKLLEQKLPAFFAQNTSQAKADRVTLRLQALSDVYFHSQGMIGHYGKAGNLNHVYGLTAVALLILLIAGFNFMNITTAQSLRRNKEVGVRKVLGAERRALLSQYLGESMLFSLISLLLGFIIVVGIHRLAINTFGNIFDYAWVDYFSIFMIFLLLSLVFGIAAGIYPAILISRFQPISILKGKISQNISETHFRQFLIFLQFTVTIGIIAGSIIISRQMDFIQQMDPGFDKEQVLALHLKSDNFLDRFESAKNILQQNPNIMGVSAGDVIDGENGSLPIWSEDMPEEVPGIPMNTMGTYFNYFKIMGIEFDKGRPFSESVASDSADGIILNRAAADAFGFADDAIGKYIWVSRFREGRVIGITENFHYNTLHDKVQPLVMFIPDTPMEYILVRTRKGLIHQTIASLENDWQKIAPEIPFEFIFADEKLNRLYESERRFASLITFFSILSIIVACLGLYGLVSIMVQYRTKEIGVRKVLGAGTLDLTILLSKQFLMLVLAANLLAWPLAYYYLAKWLSNFAYKIDMQVWPFFVAALLVLLAAMATVAYQGIKASMHNPIASLNRE